MPEASIAEAKSQLTRLISQAELRIPVPFSH